MDTILATVIKRADKTTIRKVKGKWAMRCHRHRLTLITHDYADVRRHLIKDRND